MKYFIHVAVALIVCSSTSLAAAQNRVVVIPLNSSKYEPGRVNTVTSAGQVWMDRNLGALRVATKSDEPDTYGTLYQWGRLGDGHEYRSSSTANSQSSGDVPGHGSFITGFADWRNPPNNDLWQGESGINNPCPAGFRLPTEAEWEIERASWISNDDTGAFASPLRLVLAGDRNNSDGILNNTGSSGRYWSSTVFLDNARDLYISNIYASIVSNKRARGYSVRCIKD